MRRRRADKLREALRIVQRDVRATAADVAPLRFHGNHDVLYVGFTDGTYHAPCDGMDGLLAERADANTTLAWVADMVQEAIDELYGRAWPTCPDHGLGTHVRPAGASLDWTWDDGVRTRPTWWCSRGGGHEVAPVGDLSSTLP